MSHQNTPPHREGTARMILAVYAEHLDAETVALSSELIVADGSVSGCAVATLLEETAVELRASCPEHDEANQFPGAGQLVSIGSGAEREVSAGVAPVALDPAPDMLRTLLANIQPSGVDDLLDLAGLVGEVDGGHITATTVVA